MPGLEAEILMHHKPHAGAGGISHNLPAHGKGRPERFQANDMDAALCGLRADGLLEEGGVMMPTKSDCSRSNISR